MQIRTIVIILSVTASILCFESCKGKESGLRAENNARSRADSVVLQNPVTSITINSYLKDAQSVTWADTDETIKLEDVFTECSEEELESLQNWWTHIPFPKLGSNQDTVAFQLSNKTIQVINDLDETKDDWSHLSTPAYNTKFNYIISGYARCELPKILIIDPTNGNKWIFDYINYYNEDDPYLISIYSPTFPTYYGNTLIITNVEQSETGLEMRKITQYSVESSIWRYFRYKDRIYVHFKSCQTNEDYYKCKDSEIENKFGYITL